MYIRIYFSYLKLLRAPNNYRELRKWFFIRFFDRNDFERVELGSTSSRSRSVYYLVKIKWSPITRRWIVTSIVWRGSSRRIKKKKKKSKGREKEENEKDGTVLNQHFYDFPLFSFWKIANVAFSAPKIPRSRQIAFTRRTFLFAFERNCSSGRYVRTAAAAKAFGGGAGCAKKKIEAKSTNFSGQNAPPPDYKFFLDELLVRSLFVISSERTRPIVPIFLAPLRLAGPIIEY